MDMFAGLIRLAAVIALAFLTGRLVARFRLPAILGWLIAGMVLGPHAVGLLSERMMDARWYSAVEGLMECTAGMMIGTELILGNMKRTGGQLLVMTVAESLGTFFVVSLAFGMIFWATGIPVYLAFLFGGIALATAPAPSLSIVNEFKTSGPVTRTLIPMAVLDDMVGAVVFFLVMAFVTVSSSAQEIPVAAVIVVVLLPLFIGAAGGQQAGRNSGNGSYASGSDRSRLSGGQPAACAGHEFYAAWHGLFYRLFQFDKRRAAPGDYGSHESYYRRSADCRNFESGRASGLSSGIWSRTLYGGLYPLPGNWEIRRRLAWSGHYARTGYGAAVSWLYAAASFRYFADFYGNCSLCPGRDGSGVCSAYSGNDCGCCGHQRDYRGLYGKEGL